MFLLPSKLKEHLRQRLLMRETYVALTASFSAAAYITIHPLLDDLCAMGIMIAGFFVAFLPSKEDK